MGVEANGSRLVMPTVKWTKVQMVAEGDEEEEMMLTTEKNQHNLVFPHI